MKRRSRLLKNIRLIFLLLTSWVLIHMAYVTLDGLHDYKGRADIAVVLGNNVLPDTSLSLVLKGRVDKALRLYRDGQVPKIMVSGGTGAPDRPLAEGMAMKRYLVAKGVPATDIIEDNAGENTYLTAKDFIKLNDSLHYHSVIVVSTFYHITRTKYIFRHLGFKKVYGASSDSFLSKDFIGLLREFPAFYKYLLYY